MKDGVSIVAQRLSSPACEAMPVFGEARMGSGSNVRFNGLLALGVKELPLLVYFQHYQSLDD